MLEHYILSLFLYFPEDKSEYIPAVFSFVIFLIGAIVVMRLIIVVSKKEASKAKELEEKILNDQTEDKKNS
ncbi:hypothetical protein LS684_17270 [Cytobacillus spongiae]|jgi:hypothetical protein|uniref:hypothetical protein n=1 Tax=Cytobacillus spongiae TaxID=2901381 RepID=UPI001F355FB1|nr:hypothetical protein [Cytobacillus spongiae]UII55363.1 hypothetical protein LS684_17270 [Cytobacillus spongiae]